MNKEERTVLYLAKAKDADEQAKNAKDLLAKKTWQTIAQGYRDLAKTT